MLPIPMLHHKFKYRKVAQLPRQHFAWLLLFNPPSPPPPNMSVVRVVIIAFELAVHTKRGSIAVQGVAGTFDGTWYLGWF